MLDVKPPLQQLRNNQLCAVVGLSGREAWDWPTQNLYGIYLRGCRPLYYSEPMYLFALFVVKIQEVLCSGI